MREIRLKIHELFAVDPLSEASSKSLAIITAYALEDYAFLPKPIAVTN
jgi:hypothetical protein